jgi:hypothetical protein
MLASALALVSGTGHVRGKFGELAGLYEFQILLDASFHSPEDAHPLSLKLHQGAAPDTAYNDSIHCIAGKGVHGLALTMVMVCIAIADGFELATRAVENHKRRGCAEMAIDLAVEPLVHLNRKSNFHYEVPPLSIFTTQVKKIIPPCQGRDALIHLS